MIITPNAVFIHFHKAGGQFINRLLLEHVPGAKRVGYHLPRAETPIEAIKLPAFGFVRNPWDWYVSWYTFNALNPERNPIFRATSHSGKLGFQPTIENLLRLGQPDRASMRALIAQHLPQTRDGNMGSGITTDVMLSMDEPERGYLTWLWRYMFLSTDDFLGASFGKLETLRSDLATLLGQLKIPVSKPLLEAIGNNPRVNVSPHGYYRDYYSSELQNMIKDKDLEYINAFNYDF
jgi:hypothetical protein